MTRLDELPNVGPRRVAVTVSRDALRQIRGGHPWVFDSSIRSVSHEGAPGDLAVIFGDRRQFVAIGLFDPRSPIRVRILHVGSPMTVGPEFWAQQIEAAFERRSDLWLDEGTTGFRCVHGENDALPGLVVDRYDATLVVKLYSEAWWPHLAAVIRALMAATTSRGAAVERIVLRLSRNVRSSAPPGFAEGMVLSGAAVEGPVLFLENGLRFEADVVGGQKTGHFLDQRDNRALVGRSAAGVSMLDVFACTGGFSLYAAAGAAAEVTSIDMSSRSLATAERNFALNAGLAAVAACRHALVVGDAFEEMERLVVEGRRFGVVVVDPPSFASKQADRERALGAYGRLAELGVALTEPGGLYVQSSCSSRIDAEEFRNTVLAAGGAAGRRLSVQLETGHAVDHPVGFANGAYLKTLFFRVG